MGQSRGKGAVLQIACISSGLNARSEGPGAAVLPRVAAGDLQRNVPQTNSVVMLALGPQLTKGTSLRY